MLYLYIETFYNIQSANLFYHTPSESPCACNAHARAHFSGGAPCEFMRATVSLLGGARLPSYYLQYRTADEQIIGRRPPCVPILTYGGNIYVNVMYILCMYLQAVERNEEEKRCFPETSFAI